MFKLYIHKLLNNNAHMIYITAVGRSILPCQRKNNHQRMSDIVQFIMSHPGTNASTEHVFSFMNKLWASEKKAQLQIATLKALLGRKIKFKQSCMDFYRLFQSTPGLPFSLVLPHCQIKSRNFACFLS